MMRVLAISDLHGNFPLIPECELLLLGGDYCPTPNHDQERRFLTGPFKEWLKSVPARYIVGIAGNHDFILQEEPAIANELPWIYLCESETTVEGIRIYGTPYTHTYGNWAFQDGEGKLYERFKNIPEGLDILLTHGPAYKHLDSVHGDNVGSVALMHNVKRARPDSVVCGHIHEGRGILQDGSTRYYNVAYCNGRNEPVYNPISIALRA